MTLKQLNELCKDQENFIGYNIKHNIIHIYSTASQELICQLTEDLLKKMDKETLFRVIDE